MMQWGTVPDWLMFIVTGSGFGATLWLINHEIERRRDETTERIQDQAMTVGASTSLAFPRKQLYPMLTVTNGSDGPIFNCLVRIHFIDSGQEKEEKLSFDMVHPGTHEISVGISRVALFTNTVIEFTDVGGHRWSRSSQGIFTDLGRPHG